MRRAVERNIFHSLRVCQLLLFLAVRGFSLGLFLDCWLILGAHATLSADVSPQEGTVPLATLFRGVHHLGEEPLSGEDQRRPRMGSFLFLQVSQTTRLQ